MGELRAVFDTMKKEREERREALEPDRMRYALALCLEAGYVADWNDNERAMYIYNKDDRENHIVKLYPYTGWWSGKGIGSGRGVHKLIEKLDNKLNK